MFQIQENIAVEEIRFDVYLTPAQYDALWNVYEKDGRGWNEFCDWYNVVTSGYGGNRSSRLSQLSVNKAYGLIYTAEMARDKATDRSVKNGLSRLINNVIDRMSQEMRRATTLRDASIEVAKNKRASLIRSIESIQSNTLTYRTASHNDQVSVTIGYEVNGSFVELQSTFITHRFSDDFGSLFVIAHDNDATFGTFELATRAAFVRLQTSVNNYVAGLEEQLAEIDAALESVNN